MALLPVDPANGDTTNVDGITYTYYSDQTAWVRTGTFLADFTAGNGTFTGNGTFSGNITRNGSGISALNASNITTGTVSTARLDKIIQ